MLLTKFIMIEHGKLDAIDKIYNDRTKESDYWCKIIETAFNQSFVMTKKDHEDFRNYTKCWICKKSY